MGCLAGAAAAAAPTTASLIVHSDIGRGYLVVHVVARGLGSYRGHLLHDRRIVVRVDHAGVLGRVIRDEAVTVAWMDVAQLIGAAPGVAAGQNALEGFPELCVEYRIDDGIKSRI